jgi:hypothetical protein
MARMVPTMRQHSKGAVPRMVYPTIHHGKEAMSTKTPPPLSWGGGGGETAEVLASAPAGMQPEAAPLNLSATV